MASNARKFLSLIVNEHTPGFKTLRCIDLTRQKLFYDAPAAAEVDGSASSAGGARGAATSRLPAASSETMLLPRPSFTFRPGDSDESGEWEMHCFPLGYRKVICADQSGLAFAFDAEARIVSTMSGLRRPKRTPVFLPNFSCVHIRTRCRFRSCVSSLFVMERFPEPEKSSGQFEGFFNDIYLNFFHWTRCLLPPPPPFVVRKGGRSSTNSTRPGPGEITAYTMVGRGRGSGTCEGPGGTYFFEKGSCVCVSAAGAGTYCMDMMHHPMPKKWKWTKVGKWMLPFHGKVEYVPELKLWFGFSAESGHLAAADLSGMDSLSQNQEPPQLVGSWQELDPPKEWKECRDPQIVSLGSGRFCIARFFKTTSRSSSDDDDGKTVEHFAALTGVEMVPCLDDDSQAGDDSGKGKKVTKLRMIKHESRRLDDGGSIETVF